jgi:GTP-binding protein YchF
MEIGIVGLPQAGKRTLFKLLTGQGVPESRRPGEVVRGTARVQDPRVDELARICTPRKITFAENTFVLCPDVVDGPGKRGWLDAAKRCDLLCLVVRAFAAEGVYHPHGSIDPGRDRVEIETELVLADLELVLNRLLRIQKETRGGQRAAGGAEERALKKAEAALEASQPLVSVNWSEEERAAIRGLGFVTMQPVLWAYNVGEQDLARNFGPGVFTVSCRIEQEIAAIENAGERREFLADLGLASTGLERVNRAAYAALGLISFYTIGPDEVRAWTIRRGASAPRAGGKIHSDIERGFIRVEVIAYGDLIAAGGEKEAKATGRVHSRGRDYVIQDGDICHFLFSV